MGAILAALRAPDLRKKILFTLLVILAFRVGTVIPAPGVSYQAVHSCLSTTQSGVLSLVNLFSGGALLQLSLFALGIMPYITASIILQLLTVVIPKLESLQKEGQAGQAKILQYTRYLTIGLAVLQSAGVLALTRSGNLFPGCSTPLLRDTSILTQATLLITMTGGTAVVMWLGERITQRGVGNGASILIFTSVAAQVPSQFSQVSLSAGWFALVAVILVAVVVVAAVVYVEQAQRRIPITYPRRSASVGGRASTYLPIKVNQAGVVPVIFASSLLYLPVLVSQLAPKSGFSTFVSRYLVRGDHPLYLLAYFVLVVFFAFFYVGVTFNAQDTAENIARAGGFVPGVRPGRDTVRHLEYVLSRLTVAGSLFLGVVAILPYAALAFTHTTGGNLPLGGTSVLIMVGVGLDTVKQIESQLMLRRHEGFLR